MQDAAHRYGTDVAPCADAYLVVQCCTAVQCLHPLSSTAVISPLKALTHSAASRHAAMAELWPLCPACSLVLQGPRARLSQDLVGLWADEYGPALALLRRVLPPGLMRYLNVRQEQPAQAQVGVAMLSACMLPSLSRPSQNRATLATMLCNITANLVFMRLGSTLLLYHAYK